MKHKRNIIFHVFVLILLSSCMKGDFSAYSSSFSRTIQVENGLVKDAMKMHAELSDKKAQYTFRLQSPDEDLTWEGTLYANVDGSYSSEELLLTPGAILPEGDYSAILYSSEGSDIKLTLHLPKVEVPFKNSLENAADDGCRVSYYDEEGNALENREGASTAKLSYQDRYLNEITVTESL